MIDRSHDLPISRQARLLGFARSSVYYQPVPVSETDLRLMRRLDELHLDAPFAGSRMLRDMVNREGFPVGRKHVSTLMQRLGIEALYRKPNTSKRHKGHTIYPYLLRGVNVTRANHVWAMDITYIPMAKGFVYLCAVVDWASRKILSHRISISMDTAFCLEALEEAFERYGQPEVFNTDQGSQFTSEAFTSALKAREIRISMDGKGSWRDNVFVERIWRSIKYEEVYLRAYDTVSSAKENIGRYIAFYNSRRPHSRLDKQTPDEFYYRSLPAERLAA
jgi:putative transposase